MVTGISNALINEAAVVFFSICDMEVPYVSIYLYILLCHTVQPVWLLPHTAPPFHLYLYSSIHSFTSAIY